MKSPIVTMIFALIGNSAFAATLLDMSFQAKDINVKSTMTFAPGNTIKIAGLDASGKPFTLEITSTSLKDKVVTMSCKLSRNNKLEQDMGVVTKVNEAARVESASTDGKDKTSLAVKLIQ